MHDRSLSATNLTAGYGNERILTDIVFDPKPGINVVIGENGAGKTTFFRTISGILPPLSGEVLIGGVSIWAQPELKRYVSYLPHTPALIPKLSAHETIDFWLRLWGVGKSERSKRIAEGLAAFGLTTLRDVKCRRLSRGQAQRLALARAFSCDADTYVLDEPSTGLDPESAAELEDRIIDVSKQATIILSTHRLAEAARLADSTWFVGNGTVGLQDPGVLSARGSCLKVAVTTDINPTKTVLANGWNVKERGREWLIEVPRDVGATAVMDALRNDDIEVREFRTTELELESAYRDYLDDH